MKKSLNWNVVLTVTHIAKTTHANKKANRWNAFADAPTSGLTIDVRGRGKCPFKPGDAMLVEHLPR